MRGKKERKSYCDHFDKSCLRHFCLFANILLFFKNIISLELVTTKIISVTVAKYFWCDERPFRVTGHYAAT